MTILKKIKVTPYDKHVRNCIHQHITIVNGQFVVETWGFYQEDFPCGSCGTSRDVVFMRVQPLNVVIRSCEHCGTSEQVLARHPVTGDPIADLIKTENVTADEAREFLIKSGMKARFLPVGLKRILESQPRKRRPVDISKLEDIEIEE